MKRNKNIRLFIYISLIVIAGIIITCLQFSSKGYMTYDKFYENLESGNIYNVVISDDKIFFENYSVNNKKEIINGKENNYSRIKLIKYYTDNPNSPTLKEELLKRGIKVKDELSIADMFYNTFDILFVLGFIIGAIVLYRRLSGRSLFKIEKNSKTGFDQIVGMNNLKNDIKEIVKILKNPTKYEKMGISLPKGILLEGSPGNGKTLFARALAKEAGVNFIAAKGADFESSVMAIGPMKVRALFRLARRNSPSIIFIDEFDGIGTKRNYSGSALEIENTRIVTALLNELDGFTKTQGVLVIAATNNASVLDPALIRAGRFDRKYKIENPKEDEICELYKYYLKGINISDKNLDRLGKISQGRSCSYCATFANELRIKIVQSKECKEDDIYKYINEVKSMMEDNE